MSELIKNDVRFVVQRLPRDVRNLLTAHAKQLFVGGGFVRAIIAGEKPQDIDLFASPSLDPVVVARDLVEGRPGAKFFETKNAMTILTPERLPVQIITRWRFDDPRALVNSFDFTICQAAIWRGGKQSNDPWLTCVGDRFYVDLAARRLFYTNPVREEEAGGSMLRVMKYVKRGYYIQVSSLGAVIARLTGGDGVKIAELLREVDPILVVDGLELVDDHEPVEGVE